jgi:hypothetical protein
MKTALTSAAKELLSATVRDLRERLLRDIRDEAERRYRLSIPMRQSGLDDAQLRRRGRLESWIDKQERAAKPRNDKERQSVRERILQQAVKQAGATLINRLIVIRQLEAMGIAKPPIVTGGWASKGYQEFRDFSRGLLADETEGYGCLLQIVFDELAMDLPGLFGDVGLIRLFPIPPATLREIVDRLDVRELDSAWTDDTTLGWVYQYWNDPEREEIDRRLDAQNKLEGCDIGSKTQVFTERYMVEWLLQNSLGLTWFSICKKNGWTPDAERLLPDLDVRRAEWRRKRDAGEVALDVLMPIEGELEEHWKYYVPQPISNDSIANAPDSIRSVRLLDPACGSGHFLVIAFDLLARMYREEARHRETSTSELEIAESILANNLHGVDIDPRAIQIAAAALYLKARALSPTARPTRVNLVAPALQLGGRSDEDPSLVQLRAELKREAGIPEELTKQLVSALAGVDHLGTLLKVDSAVDEALSAAELEIERGLGGQGDLFKGFATSKEKLQKQEAKVTVLARLERFFASNSPSDDLGLRLDGEQLASGTRFTRIAKEGYYDVVVGNPPYFGTQALADTKYIDSRYPQSKENLCTALLDRSMELARAGGLVAFVTVRIWLYVSQLANFRSRVFGAFPPQRVVDLELGGFDSLPGVEGMLVVAQEGATGECFVSRARGSDLASKTVAIVVLAECYRTKPSLLKKLPGSPFVYRWSEKFIEEYLANPTLGSIAPVRVGMKTSDNPRFLRCPWELRPSVVREAIERPRESAWAPYVKGAAGKSWIEPLSDLVDWRDHGLAIRIALEAAYGQGPQGEKYFFKPGVAFTTIGRSFLARAHRFPSIFDVAGSSVFPIDIPATVCLLNSRFAREVVEALNPTINFQVGDVGRVPFRPDPEAQSIFAVVEQAFSEHESTEETSCRFKRPDRSPWRRAQAWAKLAVDRDDGAPLPPYEPEYDLPPHEHFVSFGVGIALGRFGANGEGILEETPPTALPAGILFISTEGRDCLDHPACNPLDEVWKEHGGEVGAGDDLRTYLRTSFFGDHKKFYENRPIYFPLSSAKKSYVAIVSIHRWVDDTLNVLLADHLVPEKRRLEGELEDLRNARAQPDSKGKAEKRFAEVQKLLEELSEFVADVTGIAESGPRSPDDKTPSREADARFVMDLNDGVVVNSAALWPLLDPHWKDPKKWWTELATRNGPKGSHFDWSSVAKRYFRTRVTDECVQDPVLATAHRVLWKHHPDIAYSWELRIQGNVGQEFTLNEDDASTYRAQFLRDNGDAARKIDLAEAKRRERRSKERSRRNPNGGESE